MKLLTKRTSTVLLAALASLCVSANCFADAKTIGHTGLSKAVCKYVPHHDSDWTIECHGADHKLIARWSSFTTTYSAQLLLFMMGGIDNSPPTAIKSLEFSKAFIWHHKNGVVDVFTARQTSIAGRAKVNVLIGQYFQKYTKQYPGIVYKNMGLIHFGDPVS